jgi:hypothetical protein
MKVHERVHQSLRSAGAYAKHDGLLASLGGEISMAHIRVDIDRFTLLQKDRIIEFGVNFDPPVQNIYVFLT